MPALEVPIGVVMGRCEARGRVEPVRAWFASLPAPEEYWLVFERPSHRANAEWPVEHARLLDEVEAATETDRL